MLDWRPATPPRIQAMPQQARVETMQILGLRRRFLRSLKHLGFLVPIGIWIVLLRLTGAGDDRDDHSKFP